MNKLKKNKKSETITMEQNKKRKMKKTYSKRESSMKKRKFCCHEEKMEKAENDHDMKNKYRYKKKLK